MAIRLRLAATEAADLSRRATHLPKVIARILFHGLAAVGGREPRHRQPTTLDGNRWPRSELLLAEFGKPLSTKLPDGIRVLPPRGRRFFLQGTSVRPPSNEWPDVEMGQIVGTFRSFGFGFSPIGGRADMPQSGPDDLARVLAPLLKDITTSLQGHQGGWPGTGPEEPLSRTRAEGELIHIWWEDTGGQVVAVLADLDLRAAGLA